MKPLAAVLMLLATSAATAAEPAPRTVRFLAFGDYGKGNEQQYWVGQAMADVCAARGCDFALMMGDNIYPSGASSARDPQFDEKFEKPIAPLKVPVYATLGNHDNGTRGGGGENARGAFEVEYASRSDRASDKWRMPARMYRFTAPLAGGEPLAEFFSLDSNPLASTDADPDPQWSPQAYGERQQRWLADALATSKAKWRIAFFHHPYKSNGFHGNAGEFNNGLGRMAPTAGGALWHDLLLGTACGHGVDFMFQGHDHDLQWLKPETACGKTQFIVSGAAASPYPFNRVVNPAYWQQDRVLGFFWIELRENDMTGAAYVLSADVDDSKGKRATLPMKEGRPVAAFEQVVPWVEEVRR